MYPLQYKSTYRVTPKQEAQEHLSGRTHYVDDSTLAYFNCRVVSVRRHFDGLLLSIIERLPCGTFDGPRRSRFVIFDVCGNVVNDIERNEEYRTNAQAEKARNAYIESLSPAEVYNLTADAINTKNRSLSRDIEDNRQWLASIRESVDSAIRNNY